MVWQSSWQGPIVRIDTQKAFDGRLPGKKSTLDCSLPLFTDAGNSLPLPAMRSIPKCYPMMAQAHRLFGLIAILIK